MDLTKRVVLATAVAALAVCLLWNICSIQQTQQNIEVLHESTVALAAAEPQALVRVLPQDAADCHTSLYVNADWRRRPLDRKLMAWFEYDPGILSVRGQTHSHVYTTKHRLFRERYRKTVPVLPAVRVQQPDGKVLYQVSDKAIPASPGQLADEMAGCLFKNRKKRRNPEPAPTPDVDVDVDVVPVPPIPDVIPDVSVQPEFPWLLLVIAVLISAAVPVIVHFKNAFRG